VPTPVPTPTFTPDELEEEPEPWVKLEDDEPDEEAEEL
jgi:hypothetical protein